MSKQFLHNESACVEAMRQGDKEAFTILYRHYSPSLYSAVLRIVKDRLSAEEIIQELFTRVWQKRESTGLQENFSGYIYRMAQNLVYDFFRKIKSDQRLQERFRKLAEEQYDPVEEALIHKESSVLLNKAIEQLSPQQKKVYQLVKMEGCTYKKASEIMGISPFTVKEYLVATNKAIRRYMLTHMDATLVLAWLITSVNNQI